MSRSSRILTLLVIDVIFFFIELISGYAVGSLALVADSFHMLNDVLSLIVALYAIKLSKNTATDVYSYGWHRAEILGALINGVFLLALCCSIFMEAIERFVAPPEISNPVVIMVVGSFGLLSNFVGLLLFHEHSHSHSHSHDEHNPAAHLHAADERTPLLTSDPVSESDSVASLYNHPAQTRAQIVQAGHDLARSPSIPRRRRLSNMDKASSSPIIPQPNGSDRDGADVVIDIEEGPASVSQTVREENSSSAGNTITVPTSADNKGHSHSHGSGSMNMHALLLHVIGDALGNVGVILTGFVILIATGTWKYYFDPAISLVITVIIFSSALPLVKSTSLILLQGVPSHVSLNDIRTAICDVPGVLSVHELHVWQLSENKVVASVHVRVTRDSDYMAITGEIKRILHENGVHSATVQPEAHSHIDGDVADGAACLLTCPQDSVCDADNACCPPSRIGSAKGSPRGSQRSIHHSH